MKFKLLTASLALIIANTAFAETNAPTSCPFPSAFKNIAITNVMKDEDGSWLGVEWKNNFGTTNEWTFAVGDIEAESAGDALVQVNTTINELSYQQGPIKGGNDNITMWICIYSTPVKAFAAATITPAMSPEMLKASRILQKR